MIRLLLSLFLISTVVYAHWTGNWINKWNTAKVPINITRCAPDSFSITQNSSNYAVNYNFTKNFKNPSCLIGNVSQQYVSSNLTYNPASNSWFDSFNQSLAFYIYDEITTWTLCTGNNSACNISLVFYRVGSDPDQTFLFHSSYGTWLTPTPVNGSNPSICNPPVNITVKDSSYGYRSNRVSLTYRTGLTLYEVASPLTSSTLGLNWKLDNRMIISNSYNSTLNQTYLQLQMSASCIFSYAKLTGFFSGTYYPDWQNGFYSLFSSIQIAVFNNTYMNLTSFSSDGTVTETLFEYSSGNYIAAEFSDWYRYDPVADALFWDGSPSYHFGDLFTKNGSILSMDPFLGNWSSPQPLNNTNNAFGCCAPDLISITNSTNWAEYILDAEFFFSQETANSASCLNNNIHNIGDYLSLTFTIKNPNPYQLFWSGQYGYVISLTNASNWSQITVTLNGLAGNCSVTMTPGNSSGWIEISLFSLILLFITMSGLI